MSILGTNLRKLREGKGLTQVQFGEKIGMAESTISLYESGKREPDIATLQRISVLYDVAIDYLICGNSNICSTTAELSPPQLSVEDLKLLEIARELKNLSDTDRKEIESYIQYKKNANKTDELAATAGK